MLKPGLRSCLVAGLLCLTCALPWRPLSANEQAAQQARLEQLKRDIRALEKKITEGQSRKSREEKALQQVELRINRQAITLLELDQERQQLNQRLQELAKEEVTERKALKQQQGLLADQVRSSFSMGREQGIKLLLNAQDPLQLQRMLSYYEHLNQARSEAIHDYRDSVRKLEELQKLVESKNQQLGNNQRKTEQARAALQSERNKRQQTLAQLDRQLNQDQGSLKRKRASQAELEKLLKELEKALAELSLDDNAKPFRSLKSRLPWPTQGRIGQRFGGRFATDLTSTGIIIESALNQPVRAIHHGRVIFASPLAGFGMLLIIDHSDDYMSIYGFNQALLKEPGDWVNQGDVIALSGDSGGQQKPGLYFEIRHQGKPDNPLKWLRKKS